MALVVKHFPGMGRVSLNTDVSANVHNTETTRTDPYLMPFKAAIDGGLRRGMISTADYDKIDPSMRPPFSSVIMRPVADERRVHLHPRGRCPLQRREAVALENGGQGKNHRCWRPMVLCAELLKFRRCTPRSCNRRRTILDSAIQWMPRP